MVDSQNCSLATSPAKLAPIITAHSIPKISEMIDDISWMPESVIANPCRIRATHISLIIIDHTKLCLMDAHPSELSRHIRLSWKITWKIFKCNHRFFFKSNWDLTTDSVASTNAFKKVKTHWWLHASKTTSTLKGSGPWNFTKLRIYTTVCDCIIDISQEINISLQSVKHSLKK